MKAKELLPKKNVELIKTLVELEKKLTKVRIDVALKKHKNYAEVKDIKTSIARIKTVLRERELIELTKEAK